MSFPARPLLSPPAFDGMALAPSLERVWGSVPADATLEKLRGDASTRSYYRVASATRSPASLVVMRLPEGSTPAALGCAELPFVALRRYLDGLGIEVPAVFVDASTDGLLLLEDLGDETFEARLVRTPRTAWLELYAQAIDVLSDLHERAARDPACLAYQRAFDAKLLHWELVHFRDWGLRACDVALSPSEDALLERAFDWLVSELLALPQGFTHRDYQSRNLMWAPRGALVVIDFQDALLGPLGYDLAALLCDSYVALDEDLQHAALTRYAARRGLDQGLLLRAFRLVSVQRKLKDAGRFVFIDQVRGNPAFLPWYGRSIAYAARAMRHVPELGELEALLSAKLQGFPDAVPAPSPRTGIHPDGVLPPR